MKKENIRKLTEGAIMIALAVVLSYIRVWKLPWGGSVTLLSMLPIVVFSIKWGVKSGMFVSVVYALFQLGQGIIADGLLGWGLTPVMLVACIFFDYLGAFSVLGLAGLFRKKGFVGWIAGTAAVVALRFVCHLISGAAIFHSAGMLWEGFATENEWLYSTLYNGSYMLPEMIFTTIGAAVLFGVPAIRKIIAGNLSNDV